MRIKIVLGTGLALIAVAVFVALLHAPETVIATNGVRPQIPVGVARESVGVCQQGETLPAGTSTIRLQIEATTGPRVTVEALDQGQIVARGTQGPAWFGSVVNVPVRPLDRTLAPVTVCFQLSSLSGQVAIFGSRTSSTIAATAQGKPLPGRLRISYLTPARESWWSLAGAVIKHMGLGRAGSGTWIVFPIAALAAAAIAVGSAILVRELR